MTKKLTMALVCVAYVKAKERRNAGIPMPDDIHPWFRPYEQTFIKEGRWRWMPYDLLHEWTGASYDECWAAMRAAHKSGHIVYGLHLRWGWLTPKGERLLRKDYGLG